MSRQPYTAAQYRRLVHDATPGTRMWMGYVRAFWVGGTICALGQALNDLGDKLNLCETTGPMFTSVVLIFLGTTLTGLGIYDRIGKYAGCGSIVPITGFANSVAAPALEYRREGMIIGIGAKLFTLAGPVLVYGITASIIVGILYWALRGWLL